MYTQQTLPEAGVQPSFGARLLREWQLIRRDGWMFSMVTWLPLLLCAVMWGIFSAGIARDLPIGVVDLDNSTLSRQLIRTYDASPVMSVASSYTQVNEGSRALKGGDVYAVLVIPPNLEKQTKLGESPTVTVWYNSQYILVGKLINSAVLQAQGTLNAQVETLKNMAMGSPVPVQALGKALSLRSQITPLYNSNSHYGQFLVAAAIPAIWQIAIVITMVMALSAESRSSTIQAWAGGQPLSALVAKLLPYLFLFALQGQIFFWFLYGVLDWPMHGHWGIILLAQVLMVLACQGVACLFYLLPLDATKAMSFAAGFTAPAFAFVGVTFPVTDMPAFAQWWRAMLPVSHYLDIQLHQVNHGQSWAEAMPQLAVLLVFMGLFIVAWLRLKTLAAVNRQPVVSEGKTVSEGGER
ncbi:multidrug ABC transporter permease [Photobacterium aquae]|uniref:Multidrug ABC transporter permease n=1 Tax=Photobacterium aquae TaxID=1195763 RepID=A0A0J1JN25_9GAMM|nr:ABC transporter permease [Photobacterium aquae]KLV03622.1 multidrug ABC transporter permease [Photobacterium aquae]